MTNQLDILTNALSDFSDIKQSGDEFSDKFTACFHTQGRVLSYIEENRCVDNIKKAGGMDVKTLDRSVGVCKFSFKWIQKEDVL